MGTSGHPSTAILGALVAVVAVGKSTGNALTTLARFLSVARVAVRTKCGIIRDVQATDRRVARIVRAGLVVSALRYGSGVNHAHSDGILGHRLRTDQRAVSHIIVFHRIAVGILPADAIKPHELLWCK